MTSRLIQLLRPRHRPYRLLQIEASLQCSLRCVMCPWSELRGDGGLMAWATFERISASFPQAESVDLTGGGEPLAHPRLTDMVAAAKGAGCTVGFSTNGMGLDRPMAESLLAAGLDWVSFSVDAAAVTTYERIRPGARFAQVIGNMADLRDLKAAAGSHTPTVIMVFVVMRENYAELPAYIELAHSLGVAQIIAKNLDVILKEGDDARRVFAHDVAPTAGVEAVLAEAHSRARRLGVALRVYALQPQEQAICEHDPLRSVFFNWEGHVSPCITLSYAEDRVFDGQRCHVPCERFGDINDETLAQIWVKPAYREFRRVYEARTRQARDAMLDAFIGGDGHGSRPPAPEGCRTCYYLYGV